jgi:hypothetical protein
MPPLRTHSPIDDRSSRPVEQKRRGTVLAFFIGDRVVRILLLGPGLL